MAHVVLIENPNELDPYTEGDMRRWWQGRCVKITRDGEVFFVVGNPVAYMVREGIKRLASFGIRARGAYR